MQVVIIGASGATGSELMKILIADQQTTKIVALVRRALGIRSDKVEEYIINFDSPHEWEQLVQGDVAFSCLGTTIKKAGSKEIQYKIDYQYQLSFAQAASKNNVSTFILISAFSANSGSRFFYPRMKGELEDAIETLPFKNYLFFRPGLLSRPDSDRTSEKTSEYILAFFNKLGLLKNYKPLNVKALAQLMFQYAKQANRGKIIIEADQILKEVK